MSFGAGDRKEVEGLMSKITTTIDALGRSKRDIKLVLRINPHWPPGVRVALEGYVSAFEMVLSAFDAHEELLSSRINEAYPLE